MLVKSLREAYKHCNDLGICMTMQEFSTNLICSGNSNYMRNVARKQTFSVPAWVGPSLIYNLSAIREQVSGELADNIDDLIENVKLNIEHAKIILRRQ